jgi:hypothetical protein
MKTVLNRYRESGREIQIGVRDKVMEGRVVEVRDTTVHIIGDKLEYDILLEHILFVGAKLDPQQQKPKTVGF